MSRGDFSTPSKFGALYDFEQTLAAAVKLYGSKKVPCKTFWVHEWLVERQNSYAMEMHTNFRRFCEHPEVVPFLEGKKIHVGTYLSMVQLMYLLKNLGLIEPIPEHELSPYMTIPERGAAQAGKKRQFYRLIRYQYPFHDPGSMPREWASPLKVLAQQRNWESKM